MTAPTKDRPRASDPAATRSRPGETIYVAGPMRGLPDHNYPAFNEAAALLRARGATVVNPVEVNHGPSDDGTQAPESHVRRDLLAMLGAVYGVPGYSSAPAGCTGIALLPGWERSVGARCEVVVALTLGFRFYDATTGEPIAPPLRVVCTGGYGVAPGAVDTLDAIADESCAWANQTFGRATPSSKAEHLRREAEELCKDPTDLEEMADVFLLLSHAISGREAAFREAARAKLEKNKRRLWGAPDAHGVVEHTAEGAHAGGAS